MWLFICANYNHFQKEKVSRQQFGIYLKIFQVFLAAVWLIATKIHLHLKKNRGLNADNEKDLWNLVKGSKGCIVINRILPTLFKV